EIRQVAADARSGSPSVFASRVAGHAIQRCMHPRQCEASELCVIKSNALPVVDSVAILALRRKSCRDVVGGSGLLERLLMAGVALNRESLELPDSFALVTIRAIQPRMATH